MRNACVVEFAGYVPPRDEYTHGANYNDNGYLDTEDIVPTFGAVRVVEWWTDLLAGAVRCMVPFDTLVTVGAFRGVPGLVTLYDDVQDTEKTLATLFVAEAEVDTHYACPQEGHHTDLDFYFEHVPVLYATQGEPPNAIDQSTWDMRVQTTSPWSLVV